MRLSKRHNHPLFISDEHHEWKPRRSLFSRLSIAVLLAFALIGLILLVTA